jgi:hypothetical protein
MRRNRKFQARGKVQSEEVCRVAPSILYSGDILSDMAIGDTLAPIVLSDRLEHLIRADPINVEPLAYHGLN